MGRNRRLAVVICAVGLVCALAALLMLRPTPAVATLQGMSSGSHVGVASCSGSTCHGRSEATGKIVRQDELLIWQDESSPSGAHSRAWRVLQLPRSKAIAPKQNFFC